MTSSIILSLAALILAAGALAGSILTWWNLRSLNRLRESFFTGSSGGDMETVINSLVDNFQRLQQEKDALEQSFLLLKNNFDFAVQKVGIVRFNPFADGGGNFSFSVALLDGRNNGVVITSMHGRQQNRIYSKKIKDNRSDSELTDEEQKAVLEAVDFHNQNVR